MGIGIHFSFMRTPNPSETWQRVSRIIEETPVVDAHTHIQDDITGFTAEMAGGNLSGTQAAFNRPSSDVVSHAVSVGRLSRRSMLDPTHALFYSWFAEIVEGANNRLDEAIGLVGDNSIGARKQAGRFLLEQLRDSRLSEYAGWLRFMFRLYEGVTGDIDPLDPSNFDLVWASVERARRNPDFSARVLSRHRVKAYVTSIENRDRIPLVPPVRPRQVDLAFATHPEAWSMFDLNGLLWPERATDFGLFTQGHKFQAEKYLLHLEEYLERELSSVDQLKDAVRGFFFAILRSPRTNPTSRILYVDGFQSEEFRFSRPYSRSSVDYALRHHKAQLEGTLRDQVISCVAEAMLEALEDIGREYREARARFGCCIQLCGGARHFMDLSREIQSLPVAIPRLPQDEYPVWIRYPNVHFEYICAHESLYSDMANAAKQVGNVSAGPWWHFFRRHKIAQMIHDQISMGPLSSIACGFTDARFVEMLAAKYQSMRLALADALTALVEDDTSVMHGDFRAVAEVAEEMLLRNPAAVHHIPLERRS
jgi:hypothetical protein